MVELLIAESAQKPDTLYQPATEEGIEWCTERRSSPGKLTFKVIKDDILNFTEAVSYTHLTLPTICSV